MFQLCHLLLSPQGAEVKAETAMVASLLEGVASGGAELSKSLEELTEEIYFRIEVQLVKAAVSAGSEKVRRILK